MPGFSLWKMIWGAKQCERHTMLEGKTGQRKENTLKQLWRSSSRNGIMSGRATEALAGKQCHAQGCLRGVCAGPRSYSETLKRTITQDATHPRSSKLNQPEAPWQHLDPLFFAEDVNVIKAAALCQCRTLVQSDVSQ